MKEEMIMNAILLLNKSKYNSSAQEINILKKEIKESKIGHTGTLDPIASGLLIVLLGSYTKLCDEITSYDKEYIANIKVGIKTDTLDLTGTILEEKEEILDKDKLVKVINSYKKTYMQEVPSYSSVRIDGKHLYQYTRSGIKKELPKREVTINDIELLEVTENSFKIRCNVSKGTYIRSLIRDILNDLNVIGTMEDLKRTKQGVFDIKDSYTIDDVRNNKYSFVDIETILEHEKRQITDSNRKKILNGHLLEKDTDKKYIFFYEEDKLKAIYKEAEKDNNLMRVLLFI